MPAKHLVVYDAQNTIVPLHQLWNDHPTLLFFLRNPGCAICRSKLFELRDRASLFQAEGVNLAAVTMVSPMIMSSLQVSYRLPFDMYSDFRGLAYQAFGFTETSVDLFNDPEVLRHADIAEQKGFKLTDPSGMSVAQLGGLVLFQQQAAEPAFVHVADPIYYYPPWEELLQKVQLLVA